MEMRNVRQTTDLVGRLRPFAAIDARSQQALADISHIRRLTDGALILLEGDAATPVYFVLEGAVRVFRTSPEGREQTLIYLHAGEALNLPGAFASHWNVPASAESVGEVKMLAMAVDDLRRVAMEYPDVGLALLSMLAERVQHLSLMVYDLGLLSVRARVARFLLSERSQHRETPVRWTHTQIASRVGTVRVVVSRTLSALASEGMIRLNQQRIEIADPVALARVAEIDTPS
jgi:CRP/FNR family transcriptional regulator